MRDKLIELLKYRRHLETSELADVLLENGVIVVDVNIVPPPNRPLITHCFGRPINEILDIIKAYENAEAEAALKGGEGK